MQLDSTLMLWGYAMPKPGEEHWKRLWMKKELTRREVDRESLPTYELPTSSTEITNEAETKSKHDCSSTPVQVTDKTVDRDDEIVVESDIEKPLEASDEKAKVKTPIQSAKAELYSELSIVLTLISILVAFAISIIEFMGIALEKCASCADAAENSEGLDGRWWRFWGACNDSSGYIGAGIVGVMLLCGAVYLGLRKYRRKQAARAVKDSEPPEAEGS